MYTAHSLSGVGGLHQTPDSPMRQADLSPTPQYIYMRGASHWSIIHCASPVYIDLPGSSIVRTPWWWYAITERYADKLRGYNKISNLWKHLHWCLLTLCRMDARSVKGVNVLMLALQIPCVYTSGQGYKMQMSGWWSWLYHQCICGVWRVQVLWLQTGNRSPFILTPVGNLSQQKICS